VKGFVGLTVVVLLAIGIGAGVEAWTFGPPEPSVAAFLAAVNRLYRQTTPDEFTATLTSAHPGGVISERQAVKRLISLCNYGPGARVEASVIVRTSTSRDPEWAIFIDPPGKHLVYPTGEITSATALRKVRGSPINWYAGFVDTRRPQAQVFCTFGYDPQLPLLPVFAPTFVSASTSEATTTGTTPTFPSTLGTARRRLQQLAREWATSNGDHSLHSGVVYLTTREQAAGGDIVNSNQPVYELVLRGRFVCHGCSRPAGAPVQRGTVLTVTVDRATFEITDFGLGNRLNPPLPHAKSYVLRF